MDKKTIVTLVVIAGVIGAGAFLGGVKYGMSKNALDGEKGQFVGRQSGMQNRQGIQNQQGVGQNRHPGVDGGFSGGEIISKDDKSITIKTRDGGSKIVYFSESTSVGKEVSGTSADLTMGQQVMINGKVNTDGSIAAQSIQVRSTQ